MIKTLITLILLLGLSGLALGQSAEVPYTLTVYGGGGYAHGLSAFDPPVDGVNRDGFAGDIRVMWKPDYLISAGLEVGHTNVYSIEQSGAQADSGTSGVTATNKAWPIIMVFSMSPYTGVELQAGFGMAISEVTAESFGSSASSSGVGSAFMLSGAYLVPLSGEFRLGGELKYTHMNKYDDHVLAVQVVLAYKLLEW